MQTSCRIYRNSGFNAVNIPDSPALLDTIGNFVDCYALDLNQERFLPTVKIRGDWLSCKDCDYCKVGDFYYFVDNVQMLSGDVAELTLTPDFITSAGGPAALDILDGVTDRVHITDDSFGLYGAYDPYMAPALDMDVVSATEDFSGNEKTFIETTLDLMDLGEKAIQDNVSALTCVDMNVTDPDGNNPYVAVPKIKSLMDKTDYDTNLVGSTKNLKSINGQGLYEVDVQSFVVDKLKEGVALARALGVEESISGQFSIPGSMITVSIDGNNPPFVSKLTGKLSSHAVSGVPFVYGTANNARVWYGSFTPYTLTTASGSSLSAKAEEIYSGGTGPQVLCVADPRRTGKPYFRFNPLNGKNAYSDPMDFFRGAVAGTEWKNDPMVFNAKSGALLDQANYQNSMQLAALDLQQTSENRDLAVASGWLSAILNGAAAVGSNSIGSMISTPVNAGIQRANIEQQYEHYVQKYNKQKAIEEKQLQISQNVTVPEIKFPLDPQLFSEVTGNGYMVSRVVYKAADISRIDKILTAYGYKYSKILETTDFTNRIYFNYVSGSIAVGSLPRWWADGISAQIGSGVRVWHVKPNHLYYSSNPVRV